MGTKKAKLQDFNKKRSHRLQITRGFKIFRIQIKQHDPFLAKKVKTGFSQFLTIFFQKLSQMFFNINFETGFEISSSFEGLHDYSLFKFQNFDFLVPIVIAKFLMTHASIFPNSELPMSDSESESQKT